MKHFTNFYPVSKTLRFELQPIGKTKENIEKNGILERDNLRANNYKSIKKVMDEYHKAFIEQTLGIFIDELDDDERIAWEDALNDFYIFYHLHSSEPTRKERLITVQETLRKLISSLFTKKEQYKRLFGKELVREDLTEFVYTPVFEAYLRKQKVKENLNDEEICDIQENLVKEIATFRNFTTYFSGFYENRKNLYTSDDKATSIAHRLIDENLPKFVDNMGVFAKIEDSEISTHFGELYKAMEPWLNVLSINEMFKLEYFQMVLTQKQIDVYNSIIGGRTLEDGSKIRGLNEYINLYNQKQKDKSSRLPKLKPLFKQILSERNAISWLPDEFESDNHMLESIEKCYQDLNNHVFESLKELLKSLDTYDLEHIYLPNDLQLTEISQKHYGSWSLIKSVVLESLKAIYPQKRNENIDEYEKRLNKLYDSFSIADINNLVQNKIEEFEPIEEYFAKMGVEDDENGYKKPNLLIRIETAHHEVASLLKSPYPEGRNLSQDKVSVEKIKNLMDAIKDLQHFVKPLLGKGTESEKDNNFYGEFVPLWEMLDKITPLYNMVRNRMIRKPYSDEKIKLYFENNGSFLNGWVDSKTESDNATQYGGYLFRKRNSIGEYDYYLGVSAATKLFRSFNPVADVDKSSFERLDYYQLKGKTFYGALYKGDYEEESSQIKRAIDCVVNNSSDSALKKKINAERTKKQSKITTAIGYLKFIRQQNSTVYNLLLIDNAFEKSNQVLMNSIKSTLLSLDRIPSAKEYAQRNYSLFSEMMDDLDVLLQTKIFTYFPVSQNELEEVVNRTIKPLYLFKITNKDLSFAETNEKGLRNSRGIDNLHTMYFKALMSGCQDVFDIGSGSVFFRERKIVYSKEQLKKGHHYEMLKEKFNYPIISKKRYAFDKFQFHLSITMNYNADKSKDLNPYVNAYLKDSNATHIIGIDRGERHLLYLSLIDCQGNIIEQFSLNEIVNEYKGNTYHTNYHDLLNAKEKQRDEARRSWQSIESIKELKEGYMSQVIHKIAELMLNYNAIVVLEDLNQGFMRGRQKVEKQVYQKFEKMLIDKLNYLVDKKCKANEMGGVLKAYQLTNKFESFQKLKLSKQSGFLFYVPAWNTSKMDPTTGFVNLFDTHYESIVKAKAFFSKFDSIRFNEEKDWFEFNFDYNNEFTTKAEGTKTCWTLCTYGTRIETKRDPKQNGNFVSEEINSTCTVENTPNLWLKKYNAIFLGRPGRMPQDYLTARLRSPSTRPYPPLLVAVKTL